MRLGHYLNIIIYIYTHIYLFPFYPMSTATPKQIEPPIKMPFNHCTITIKSWNHLNIIIKKKKLKSSDITTKKTWPSPKNNHKIPQQTTSTWPSGHLRLGHGFAAKHVLVEGLGLGAAATHPRLFHGGTRGFMVEKMVRKSHDLGVKWVKCI